MTGTVIRTPSVAGAAARRRKLVLADWKMNGSRDAVRAWCEALRCELAGAAPEAQSDLGLLPPFPYLGEAARGLSGTGWRVGAQDLSPHDAGAFTGDVSRVMLAELGCAWALVGHSERRAGHGESDALVAAKLAAALRAGPTPVLCVGETLEERETGATKHVLRRQIAAVLDAVGAGGLTRAVIAYEPVWAVGTGRTASPGEARRAHALVKPNVEEAAELLGRPILTDEDALEAGRELRARGAESVVVSQGEGGAVAIGPGGCWKAVPPRVVARSTVGSGDSMVAGLAVALAEGRGLEDGLRLGTACGAAPAAVAGTRLCEEDGVDALLARVVLRELRPAPGPRVDRA